MGIEKMYREKGSAEGRAEVCRKKEGKGIVEV
jgi:hypothetical protein